MLRLRKAIWLVLPVAVLWFGMCRPAAALDDAILAVVNDQIITLSDLREYIKGVYLSLVAEGKSKDEIQKTMLDMEINGLTKLIEDKLILSRANQLGLIVKDKLVDERIEDVKKRYPDEKTFETALNKSGGTMSDLRKKILEQLKMQFVIDHEVRSKIFVNPQEITDYYQKHMDQFQSKERVKLKSIYMSYGKDKEQTLKKANVALALIENGEDFDAIAKEYSETPSIGMVERGQLLPAIEKVVFHMRKGVPSDLIETDDGVYIFLVDQKLPASVTPLEKVREDIEKKIFAQKFQARLKSWIAQLKKDAYIDIKK